MLLNTQLNYIKISGEGTSAVFPSMVLLYNYAEAKTTLDSKGKRRNNMLAVSRSSLAAFKITLVCQRSQDGGGIGRGDHFLSYKFIERTIER